VKTNFERFGPLVARSVRGNRKKKRKKKRNRGEGVPGGPSGLINFLNAGWERSTPLRREGRERKVGKKKKKKKKKGGLEGPASQVFFLSPAMSSQRVRKKGKKKKGEGGRLGRKRDVCNPRLLEREEKKERGGGAAHGCKPCLCRFIQKPL